MAEEWKGGTVCPECGKRQGHLHLGWLDMPDFKVADDGVLFTYLNCDKCGTSSFIIRYEKNASSKTHGPLQKAIWALFGKEVPQGGGCISI